ncbi:hypothetical protein F5J12DRAFT_783346 [Pisolithus orientalis]|uniref:uncharacterized protein n=1 Tax=Pisolithus orientalis TaxID=936130 RepID=UPI0022245F11|nr:uncharacterized protein F5J12DRAFT_783346 [Pisolithus orientalis]KAI6004350.1 hypothetical protein F5J12DRAFT_783346 [Pisolithus orientalis]
MAEAKCVPDNWEDMCWEEKMVVLMPLVEQGKALRVSVWVDTEDAPVLAEADDLHEWWAMEEADACVKAEQDVQMGEETVVELSDDSVVKMSHMEVLQLACKVITESNDDERPKVSIPPRMKQGCK